MQHNNAQQQKPHMAARGGPLDMDNNENMIGLNSSDPPFTGGENGIGMENAGKPF